MFSQELLTNGELNHFSLKERMVEIGKRWQKLSQSQKDKYKKLVEEQQVEYKAELETWVKVTATSHTGVVTATRGLETISADRPTFLLRLELRLDFSLMMTPLLLQPSAACGAPTGRVRLTCCFLVP